MEEKRTKSCTRSAQEEDREVESSIECERERDRVLHVQSECGSKPSEQIRVCMQLRTEDLLLPGRELLLNERWRSCCWREVDAAGVKLLLSWHEGALLLLPDAVVVAAKLPWSAAAGVELKPSLLCVELLLPSWNCSADGVRFLAMVRRCWCCRDLELMPW